MVSKKEISFEKSIPYHVLTRAVEGREIFINEEDCYRFIFQMQAANIGRSASNLHRRDIIKAAEALLNGEKIPEKLIIVEHPPLVDFLSFVLVINHPHFILVPNVDFGIPKYMQKLKTGFSMYFNLKHNRKGNVFERPYKIIPIQTDFQLDAVLRYVNVKNPLDVYQPGWRKTGLRDKERAFKFLNEYQFSSFPDLFGKRKSKILAPKEVLEKYFGKEITFDKEEFLNFIKDYLQKNLIPYYPFFLEE